LGLSRLAGRQQPHHDRPAQGQHPPALSRRHVSADYGYLENTSAIDGGGIDVWVGSTGADRPDAIICTVDVLKRDAEIKLLIGCSESEKEAIVRFLNGNAMRGMLIRRA
jgi:inorganic pyrophosphatase